MTASPHRQRSVRRESSRSKSGTGYYAQSALLLAALGAVFLAGGPMEGGMGLFLAVSGLVMLSVHPTQTSPWMLWGLGGMLLVTTGASLIPQALLGNSGVREFIRPVPILALPESITLEPSATIFWLLLLSLSILIALYSLSMQPAPREMEDLALLAVLGCSVYALVALDSWQTGWHYPFFEKPPWSQPFFGFFPNRNHTAGFLISGAILSLGLIFSGTRGRRLLKPCVSACAFSLILSILLFTSISRGGLLFLLLGVVIWVAGLGRHRSYLFLWLCIALTVVFLALFLSSSSSLLERLTGRSYGDKPKPALIDSVKSNPNAEGFASDMRLKIWSDTLSIIKDYPATGTGFGTYSFIYPFYADRSLRDQSTAFHAESDWMTLCAENGIPTLLLVLSCLFLLISRVPAMASHSGEEWPVRWAFIVAFLTEVLHGLVDVPLHKPELGWWVLLLGGIGFGNSRAMNLVEPRPVSLRLQRIVFVLGGIGALFLGLMMIRAQWGGGIPLPPWAAGVAQQKIVEFYGKGASPDSKRAIEEARSAIREHPMAHPLYFQLAKMLLNSEKKVSEATQLLEAEQALSPNDPDFVFVGGWLLAEDAPMTTATFWNEALRRQMAYDDSPNSSIHRTGDLYREMLRTALGNWPLFDRLPALASNKELRMIWLTQSYCPASQLAVAVQDSAFMKELAAKEQGQLIRLWWQRGDKQEVEAFLNAHPEYQDSALDTRLAMLATAGHEEEACKLLVDHFQIPTPELTDPPSSSIRSAEGEIPTDSLEAALYYRKLGNEIAARSYLEEALNGPKKAEALRIRAMLGMRSGEWKQALNDLRGYLQSTGRL